MDKNPLRTTSLKTNTTKPSLLPQTRHCSAVLTKEDQDTRHLSQGSHRTSQPGALSGRHQHTDLAGFASSSWSSRVTVLLFEPGTASTKVRVIQKECSGSLYQRLSYFYTGSAPNTPNPTFRSAWQYLQPQFLLVFLPTPKRDFGSELGRETTGSLEAAIGNPRPNPPLGHG